MERQRKKGVTNIPGLHSMRTLQSTGKRSIPRGYQSSAFIGLYMLGKERERLEKECSIMERRRGAIERRLIDIELESEKLKVLEAKKFAEGGRAIRKPRGLKRMELHY